MKKDLYSIVENACKSDNNYFGYTSWTHHITMVIKYSKILAEKLKADKDIVEIAALFHDYSAVCDKNWYPSHHIKSGELAEPILKKHGYPQDFIEKVKYCIYTHRASKPMLQNTIEAQIVASADALAHFDCVDELLHLAYTVHKMDVDEGSAWVMKKLDNSWKKLVPEAKKLAKQKYSAAKLLLKNS